MKKSVISFIIFLLVLLSPVSGADRTDMVILLDNSISVIPYYDRIQESLIGKIITEHLKPGDTFNLITFSDSTEVEIAREIRNNDDLNQVMSYSMLLQPMGQHTDLILALRVLYKYCLDLPLSNAKKIIILTDGIHDPPEGSPYYGKTDDEVLDELNRVSSDIHKEGWDVSILQLKTDESESGSDNESVNALTPVQPDNAVSKDRNTDVSSGDNSANISTASGGNSDAISDSAESEKTDSNEVISKVSKAAGASSSVFDVDENDMAAVALGIPALHVNSELGEVKRNFKLPIEITNKSDSNILLSLSALLWDGRDILQEPVSLKLEGRAEGTMTAAVSLPESVIPGEYTAEIKFIFTGGQRVSPDSVNLHFEVIESRGPISSLSPIVRFIIIVLLAAIVIAVLLILILRKLAGSASHLPSMTSSAKAQHKVSEASSDISAAKSAKKSEDGLEPSESGAASARKRKEHEKMPVIEQPNAMQELMIAEAKRRGFDEFDIKKNRPIQMIVYGQNTQTGIFNIKWLGINTRQKIGGSSGAAFRIFLVKVPAVIATIECTGDDFILRPEIPEFFPELDGPMHGCLYRPVKVVNKDEHTFYIEFRQHISKLEKLNRYLNMTRTTGTPDLEF